MNQLRQLLTGVLLCCLPSLASEAQHVDSLRFFTDNELIEMQLSTDIRSLQNQKGEDLYQDAAVIMKFPDGTTISENITVGARGKSRREICQIPPIMMNFRNMGAPRLSSLGKLKLVIGCGSANSDEDLILKEFLVYKIYNQLTDTSFRVRLLRVTYSDTRNKVKSFTQYAFLIEDDGDMARRNGCKKKEHGQFLTEATDRSMMTLVALFQYMVGNTDWAVPNNHNVKLIFPRGSDINVPFVVPYDFDYCGLVNAAYAIPNEIIGTESVTERVYRGFPRNMEELQATLDLFRAKKQDIYATIRNFTYLSEKTKSGMIKYLDGFFKMIENKSDVKSVFIDNARTN